MASIRMLRLSTSLEEVSTQFRNSGQGQNSRAAGLPLAVEAGVGAAASHDTGSGQSAESNRRETHFERLFIVLSGRTERVAGRRLSRE